MNELVPKIESILGNTYLYNKQKIYIKDYKILTSQKIMIFTENKTLDFLPSQFQVFLSVIVKVENNIPTTTENMIKNKVALQPKSTDLFLDKADKLIYSNPINETLQDSLLEMLKKVKEDPTAIAQAKAVIDITNAAINLQKQNLEASKFITNN